MDLQSVLAIATVASAALQTEELERDFHEFELEEPPVVSGAPWQLRHGESSEEDVSVTEH